MTDTSATSPLAAAPHGRDSLSTASFSEGDRLRAGGQLYYPGLDGLRFVAFLGVFALHALLGTPVLPTERVPQPTLAAWWTSSAILSGAFGVDLFFVLSSFLITSLLLREIDIRGALDVRAFWIRRILRIWPLYFSFLLLAGVAEGIPAKYFLAFALFAGNWAQLAWDNPPYVMGHLWSVSVEEQFYLTWPVVLLMIPLRRLPWVCAGMLTGSLAVRALILELNGGRTEIWFNTFARLDPIAIGALIAFATRRRQVEIGAATRAALLAGAGLLIVGSVGYVWHHVPSAPPVPVGGKLAYLLVYLVVAMGCGAVVIATLASPRSLLAHPVVAYLGQISYGLYVFHLASLRIAEPLWWPWRAAVAFFLTLGTAAASHRLLEQPFLRLKARFTYVHSGAPTKSGAGPSGGSTLVPRTVEHRGAE